jgi:hypothetical protein
MRSHAGQGEQAKDVAVAPTLGDRPLLRSLLALLTPFVALDPRHLFSVGVCFATGVAFAYFHDRLTSAVTALAAKKQLDAHLERP